MPRDHQAQVRQFHNATGLDAHERPKLPDTSTFKFRVDLIFEESNELLQSVQIIKDTNISLEQKVELLTPIADALADILYVVYGTAVTFGIDIHPIFDTVHEANMRKVDGVVRKRGDGKILKPPGWYGPEGAIRTILREQIERPVRVDILDGVVYEGERNNAS